MSAMDEKDIVTGLKNLFLALADKTRLRLISAMAEGEVSVNFLAETVGESQPKVSRHLAYLRAMDVVTTRRSGKNVYYALNTRPESDAGAIIAATLRALESSAPALGLREPAFEASEFEPVGREDIAIHLL
jgi:DNA-binding transcriptional ArsR family regulator